MHTVLPSRHQPSRSPLRPSWDHPKVSAAKQSALTSPGSGQVESHATGTIVPPIIDNRRQSVRVLLESLIAQTIKGSKEQVSEQHRGAVRRN
jgi:hypothetical protein